MFDHAQVEDVLTNMERGPGAFVSSQHDEVPHWLAVLEWWWRCFAASWFYRCRSQSLLCVAEGTMPETPTALKCDASWQWSVARLL